MRKHSTTSAIKLTALAAALALQGAALFAAPATAAPTEAKAAVQAADQAKTGHHRHYPRAHGRHHHGKAAFVVPGYGPVGKETVESLSLTDKQQNLLEDARAAQDDFRKSRRTALRQARESRVEQLKAGKVDPRGALEAAAAERTRVADARKGLEQKWLTLWDSMSDEQQAKIGAVFQDRAEKRAQKHAEWREKRKSRDL